MRGPPASMADFPSGALEEAATAFNHQLSGLLILHASAKVHTSGRNQLATTFLGDRFDERGADLIDDGVFGIELDPVQMALGCYPILQIALHIFTSIMRLLRLPLRLSWRRPRPCVS